MPLSTKNFFINSFALVLLLAGCSKGDIQSNPYSDLPEPELEKTANRKYEAIINLAHRKPCSQVADWKMMDIQTICGLDHLAYHSTTDEQQLQKLVADYELVIAIYRPMIAPRINCMAYRKPRGITCLDGKPIFTY
ncbi:hypothetical protein [Sphingobacterium griseoflavum]|uniref:Uncharacterized protein n=1 Tax=Sphingobacterium griseoflavum TaxID=1474952 RepID=A0ABQ3I1Y5_9SPHI|nr:hypothetical protein [Sphingobacterium griseoflavum]GHE46622.1 hypothetical protein GCM10017764_32320 [Sphingobacterium griseoflavum]